ncbi:MAG: hypothetical protein P8172_01315 [Gammaproteobacteria bacterium]
MERLLQYLDELDDFVWSMPLLWEQVRRLLARLIALIGGILLGATVALATVTMPLLAGALLLAGIVALLGLAARQPTGRWTTRHS